VGFRIVNLTVVQPYNTGLDWAAAFKRKQKQKATEKEEEKNDQSGTTHLPFANVKGRSMPWNAALLGVAQHQPKPW
jgi:hypothetical protein